MRFQGLQMFSGLILFVSLVYSAVVVQNATVRTLSQHMSPCVPVLQEVHHPSQRLNHK